MPVHSSMTRAEVLDRDFRGGFFLQRVLLWPGSGSASVCELRNALVRLLVVPLRSLLLERLKLFVERGHFLAEQVRIVGRLVSERRRWRQASSIRSMALSGRYRSVIYRSDKATALRRISSGMFRPWYCLIVLLDALEYGERVLDGGLVHHDRLEPALQRRVLFNIFPVFVERCGADHLDFAAGTGRA